MQVLQVGVSLMVYPHPGNSAIRQSQSTLMFQSWLKAIEIEIHTYCKNKDFLNVRVNFLHVNVQLYVMPTI